MKKTFTEVQERRYVAPEIEEIEVRTSDIIMGSLEPGEEEEE